MGDQPDNNANSVHGPSQNQDAPGNSFGFMDYAGTELATGAGLATQQDQNAAVLIERIDNVLRDLEALKNNPGISVSDLNNLKMLASQKATNPSIVIPESAIILLQNAEKSVGDAKTEQAVLGAAAEAAEASEEYGLVGFIDRSPKAASSREVQHMKAAMASSMAVLAAGGPAGAAAMAGAMAAISHHTHNHGQQNQSGQNWFSQMVNAGNFGKDFDGNMFNNVIDNGLFAGVMQSGKGKGI